MIKLLALIPRMPNKFLNFFIDIVSIGDISNSIISSCGEFVEKFRESLLRDNSFSSQLSEFSLSLFEFSLFEYKSDKDFFESDFFLGINFFVLFIFYQKFIIF